MVSLSFLTYLKFRLKLCYLYCKYLYFLRRFLNEWFMWVSSKLLYYFYVPFIGSVFCVVLFAFLENHVLNTQIVHSLFEWFIWITWVTWASNKSSKKVSLFPSTVAEVTSISEQCAYCTRSRIQCIICLDIWRGWEQQEIIQGMRQRARFWIQNAHKFLPIGGSKRINSSIATLPGSVASTVCEIWSTALLC